MQPAIGVHAVQARSLVPAQAVLSKVPAPQVLAHVVQVSAVALTRKLPLAQVVHCWSLAPVQVSPAVQPAIGVHAAQARLVVPVQAVLSKVPAAQVLAQVAQVSTAALTRKLPLAHVVHC